MSSPSPSSPNRIAWLLARYAADRGDRQALDELFVHFRPLARRLALGYVHGHNEILAPSVHKELEGKSAGAVIEVPIDGNRIFGARDESLVFTDHLENVPQRYRQIGISILMENDKGQTRSFIVTRMDEETLTVDGNNPLCDREVVFRLEVLTVRDATDEEMNAGGAIGAEPNIDPSVMRPV